MPAIMRPAPTTRPALPPPLLSLLAPLTALLACALGCAGEPPATCGAIGRSVSCACPGGIMGAQECGPAGVWGACACPGSDGGTDVPGLEVAADVAVADAAPADAGPDDSEASPPPDVAVTDAPPDAVSDAPRSGEIVVAVSTYPAARYRAMYARCAASGWGTAAGPAATLEAGFVELDVPDPLVRVVRATVTPGPVGSVEMEGERVTSGVRATLGEPYPTGAGPRLDFEARAAFRTLGAVTVAVTGCSVGP